MPDAFGIPLLRLRLSSVLAARNQFEILVERPDPLRIIYIKEYTGKGDESQSEDSLPLEFSVENESKNKLLIIQSILKKAEKLEKEVLAFDESSKSKAYLAIEEKLTRLLIELDGIEANRDENIRLTRKRAVQQLQRALTQLEENISCRGVQNNEDKDWSLGMNRCESI